MTHIENIPHIILNGITHFASKNANQHFISIGDNSLISTRNSFLLKNEKRLGDYIPFYFGSRMPMLYVIQNGFNLVASVPAENIVYCVTSVKKIIDVNLDFVFTDGHAVDGFSTQYSLKDILQIDSILDKSAIEAKYWLDENDLDKKRRKEAEFLVLKDIPVNAILGYVVYNENAKNRLIGFGIDPKIVLIKQSYYF